MPDGAATPALSLRGIDKRFGAVHANRAVDLDVASGSIHGLIGENGAGKSTLMSILYGFYTADHGEIRLHGKPVVIPDSRAAIAQGIAMVHQHFMLVDTLSALDNIMLGVEGGALLAGGRARVRRELARLEAAYRLDVDPDALVGALPLGARQRVEILKALYRGADILILDEPTAVLTPGEADDLFRVLGALKGEGKTILLVTHKLREIMAITDRVTVMRHGEVVADLATGETSPAELGALMIGQRLASPLPKAPMPPASPALAVEGLRVGRAVRDVSFSVAPGEIVGIAGVSGNGQSELLEALSGMITPDAGSISIFGETVFPGAGFDPAALRRRRMGHVPEDRLRTGLIPRMMAWESAMLGYEAETRYGRFLLLDRRRAAADAAGRMERFDVRPRDPLLRSANFSGGNQQKLILAREIERDPLILLVGQPTRGIDVGGIAAIHQRLLALREAGRAILLVSAELDEILALADTILVMVDGAIAGRMQAGRADEARLGMLMAGHA